MKKLLLLLFSILISFNSYGEAELDFSLSDFCYLQPNVQDRDGVYFFPNQQIGITFVDRLQLQSNIMLICFFDYFIRRV